MKTRDVLLIFGLMIVTGVLLFVAWNVKPGVPTAVTICNEHHGKLIYVGYSNSYNCEFPGGGN